MLSLSLDHLSRPSPVGTFRGHSEIVWSVVFLPNGKGLVSASNDGSVRLWNLDHESEVILGNSSGAVFCLALFPDGKRIASGGLDRSVNIWDIRVLAAVDGPWKGHTSSVRYLDISSDSRYLASGSFDHKVNIWDTESGQIVRDEASLTGDSEIICVKFSRKDCRLLTGSGDGSLRIWDWDLGTLLVGPMKAGELPIWAVAWSQDETQILSGSSDGIIRRWHALTGHNVGKPIFAHDSTIYSLSFSHNGGCFASSSSDNTVKIWNATTFEQLAILTHHDEVNCIAFSTDDRLLATACSDSLVYIWELPQASLDSGLAIDRDYESLLEPPRSGRLGSDTDIKGFEPLERNAEILNDILSRRPTSGAPSNTALDEGTSAKDNEPVVAESRRFIHHFSFGRSRRRFPMNGVNNLQSLRQENRKLSEIVKAAFTKSGKFIMNLSTVFRLGQRATL